MANFDWSGALRTSADDTQRWLRHAERELIRTACTVADAWPAAEGPDLEPDRLRAAAHAVRAAAARAHVTLAAASAMAGAFEQLARLREQLDTQP